MKRTLKYAVVLLIAGVCITSLFAQGGWNQVKDSDGIKVYTRPVEGSDLDEFKGVTIINTRFEIIGEVLRDIPSQTEWMADCMASKMVRKIGENDFIVYNATKAPWPVSNRDVVVKVSTSIDEKKGVVNSSIKSIEDGSVPPKDGFVRMPSLTGKWLLEKIETEKTRVTYIIKANPGGSLPSSLANMSSKKIPFVTLKNLKKMVSRQKYIDSAKAKFKF